MNLPRVLACASLALVAAAPPLSAQQPLPLQYPASLDVPYVPTNQPAVEAMLRIANVGPGDTLIDLGSGDGRIAITAARNYGARALGVDLDPQRIKEANDNLRGLPPGVAERVSFRQQNIFETPLKDATVVTMYLLPRVNLQLRPRLLKELKPGTRVVSHDFHMEEWRADITASVRGSGSTIYYWVIPADVAGQWEFSVADGAGFPRRTTAEIKQEFQAVAMTVFDRGRPANTFDSRVDGDRFSFLWIDELDYNQRWRYEGRVAGDVMEGTVRGEGSAPREPVAFRARRTSR
ncbi:MAG: SAM-dependent methyltransferase [Burkholderiales bacterium]